MKIQCNNCQKRITIPDNFSGKAGKCPQCGKVIKIPKVKQSIHQQETGKNPQKKQGDMRKNGYISTQKHLSKSFPLNLLQAFLYPFSNIYRLLLVVFLTGVANPMYTIKFLAKLDPLMRLSLPRGVNPMVIHYIAMIFLSGYIFKIIEYSSIGKTELPKIKSNLYNFIIGETGSLDLSFLRFIGTILYCSIPIIIYWYFFSRNLYSLPGVLISLPCLYFFPMALLANIAYERFGFLDPRIIIRPLKQLSFQYSFFVLCFYACIFLNIKGMIFLFEKEKDIFILLTTYSCIQGYCFIFLFHLIGFFYWIYQDKFQWFNEGYQEEQQQNNFVENALKLNILTILCYIFIVFIGAIAFEVFAISFVRKNNQKRINLKSKEKRVSYKIEQLKKRVEKYESATFPEIEKLLRDERVKGYRRKIVLNLGKKLIQKRILSAKNALQQMNYKISQKNPSSTLLLRRSIFIQNWKIRTWKFIEFSKRYNLIKERKSTQEFFDILIALEKKDEKRNW